jgi:hypothetical protein
MTAGNYLTAGNYFTTRKHFELSLSRKSVPNSMMLDTYCICPVGFLDRNPMDTSLFEGENFPNPGRVCTGICGQ